MYQERPGDNTYLIKCLVYAEAASQPDCSGGMRQQCGLGWATNCLANALPKIRTQATASPAPARNGVKPTPARRSQLGHSRRR